MSVSRQRDRFFLASVPCCLALASACSGGGGGGGAPATIGFTSAAATIAEGGGLAVELVLRTSQPALLEPASVTVVDSGAGSASPGADYASFAPEIVSFPAGSLDGDVLTVALAALADQTVEGQSETIRLALGSPSGAKIQGSVFVATITDVDTATITFASAASSAPDESNVPRSVAVRLGLEPGVVLGVAAGARVSDAGGGTASPGSDYGSFAAVTVSFPAGSADGATQDVTVTVLDDDTIEADETVVLSLSLPLAGSAVGPTSAHVLTIEDDDASGDAALVATEGPTGVENAVAYDAELALGSQAVGAGPNAGTRLRLANAGGAALSLGPPRLSGNHPNDFAVEVESASLTAGSDSPPVDLGSPFEPLPADPSPGERVVLASGAGETLAAFATRSRVRLNGVRVPGISKHDTLTFELSRRPLPWTTDAVLRVDGAGVPGGPRALLGDLSLWSGRALELPGSRVFLAISSEGSRGFLSAPGLPVVHLDADRVLDEGEPRTSRWITSDVAELAALDRATSECEPRHVPGAPPPPDQGEIPPEPHGSEPPATESITASECRLAIETDHQLFLKLGSTNATVAYVTALVAAVGDRYFTDVQTDLSIAYLGVYSSAADPWTSQDSGGNASDLLDEFQGAWAPSSWPVAANLAHFVSGASLGGGVAYIGVLCNQSFGFGVSGNIAGNVDWGAWTGQAGGFTWDFVVVAHELGHNFNSQHTHSYCPPLDRCAANCTAATACTTGTIMSYCHTCGGGMSNIELVFHPVCANHMRNAVQASCLGPSTLDGGDWVQYLVRFQPATSTGARSANLDFTHDATNTTQPFRVRLAGTATN